MFTHLEHEGMVAELPQLHDGVHERLGAALGPLLATRPGVGQHDSLLLENKFCIIWRKSVEKRHRGQELYLLSTNSLKLLRLPACDCREHAGGLTSHTWWCTRPKSIIIGSATSLLSLVGCSVRSVIIYKKVTLPCSKKGTYVLCISFPQHKKVPC